MPDQFSQPPTQQAGLADYLTPPPEPQYAAPPDYKPDPPAIQPWGPQSTAGLMPAATYAPPPNYAPPPVPAPIVPFEQYHPGPLAQYASPPDYDGPSYDDAMLSSRTVDQEPNPGLGREPTTYGTGEAAYAPMAPSWTPQQAHEARQLMPPPHMLEQPPPRDKMDAGVPAGAPMAEDKPKTPAMMQQDIVRQQAAIQARMDGEERP